LVIVLKKYKLNQILKAKKVVGKTLYLRNVTEDDAGFIFALRTDPGKNQYLSPTTGTVDDQRQWIRHYQLQPDQAYFIICDHDDKKLGCLRIYDPIDNSYCWGSWLMIQGQDVLVAMESILLLYAYGKFLGFSDARIDVRKENESVWRFHEQFSSAVLISEDSLNRYYIVSEDRIHVLLLKYKHFLTHPLLVEPLL